MKIYKVWYNSLYQIESENALTVKELKQKLAERYNVNPLITLQKQDRTILDDEGLAPENEILVATQQDHKAGRLQ